MRKNEALCETVNDDIKNNAEKEVYKEFIRLEGKASKSRELQELIGFDADGVFIGEKDDVMGD